MLSNQKISDYVYLAEASYTDFSTNEKQLKRISGS